jgi:nitroimidazol reductase NimA-like FMN-containing flavoprotein (pyridoxamine 5'-phosphate oxidase superfamily)
VVGRLALVVSGAPALMPVNYVLDGETVVFRSGPGTKVAMCRAQSGRFEIDAYDVDAIG